jgi:hypothetical protein
MTNRCCAACLIGPLVFIAWVGGLLIGYALGVKP